MKPIQAHNPFPDRDRERTRLRKSKVLAFVAVGFMVALALTVTARSWDDHHEPKVKLLGNIPIPAPNPISSTDITWADQATGKVFFSDRSNAGVEVLDGANDLFVGRITKNAAGTLTYTGTGGAGGSSHEGPNGVVSTADKKVWAGDGDSTVKVADFDPASPTYLQIIASVNTAGLSSVSACTGGITGTCNRDDEIAYDSEHEIIAVANDEPTGIQPFLTFISAKYPYNVLGQINFAAQGLVASGGLEQPLYDAQIHRFLQTLPQTGTSGFGSIAVIEPLTRKVDRLISLSGDDCKPTGEALAPNGHLVVSCGSFPLVIDVATGNEIGVGINQVGGGDEVNYNPGDNTFILSSEVDGEGYNPIVLGVIDANSGDWIENAPPATPLSGTTAGSGGLASTGSNSTAVTIRAGNLAAWGGNSHVFVVVHPAPSTGTDICGKFGTVDYGCVAVFGPTQPSFSPPAPPFGPWGH